MQLKFGQLLQAQSLQLLVLEFDTMSSLVVAVAAILCPNCSKLALFEALAKLALCPLLKKKISLASTGFLEDLKMLKLFVHVCVMF